MYWEAINWDHKKLWLWVCEFWYHEIGWWPGGWLGIFRGFGATNQTGEIHSKSAKTLAQKTRQ
jgi:hypothetical protein